MLLHAFPSMSVSSLGAFRENCVYRHGGFNCFMKYLHRKLLTTNFSFMILKVLKNVHLLDLYIKTIIFLFYKYIHVFNSSQNDWTFWYKSIISSVEVYDKHIIACHFFISYTVSSLVHISSLENSQAEKGYDMKNAMQ